MAKDGSMQIQKPEFHKKQCLVLDWLDKNLLWKNVEILELPYFMNILKKIEKKILIDADTWGTW